MNKEREQLKEQYKKYIDKFEAESNNKNLKGFCSDHCNLKDALELLIHAKYLDFMKEDEDDKAKKDYRTQAKVAIITAVLSLFGTLAMAVFTFYTTK